VVRKLLKDEGGLFAALGLRGLAKTEPDWLHGKLS
jgi:hypothetical protein